MQSISNPLNQRRKRALRRRTEEMHHHHEQVETHRSKGGVEFKRALRKYHIALTDITNLNLKIIG